MEKKIYSKPECEIISFEAEDIIITSGDTLDMVPMIGEDSQ